MAMDPPNSAFLARVRVRSYILSNVASTPYTVEYVSLQPDPSSHAKRVKYLGAQMKLGHILVGHWFGAIDFFSIAVNHSRKKNSGVI